MTPFTVGIDVGTTGAKAAIVGLDGRVESLAVAGLETLSVEGGGREQDPEAIWTTVQQLVRDALGQSRRRPEECAGMLVTSQYLSIVPVDANGRPLHNLILWGDPRGARYSLEVYQRHPETMSAWVDVHGMPPSPSGGVSLAHLQWLRHERPDVHESTFAFLEASDYVTARLTGNIASNACTAFAMQLTDHRQPDEARYDSKLIELAGVDAAKLPELVAKNANMGPLLPSVADAVGLPRATPVFAPMNDTQAVAVGAGAVEDGVGGISVGTTSALVTPVRDKRSDVAKLLLSMPSPLEGDYLVMAENGLGGKVVEHALERWLAASDALGTGARDRYAALDQIAGAAPAGCRGARFLPWLTGSVAPRPSDVRGGFVDLSLAHDRAHLARAVLEGVAFNLRWLTDEVESFAGPRLETLSIGGGGARLASLCQILADVLGRPIRRVDTPRAIAARGAGLLAFERLGELDRGALAKQVRVDRVFEPHAANGALYDAAFARFLAHFEAQLELGRATPEEAS